MAHDSLAGLAIARPGNEDSWGSHPRYALVSEVLGYSTIELTLDTYLRALGTNVSREAHSEEMLSSVADAPSIQYRSPVYGI